MTFTCCTCKDVFSVDDISKHLSSTRHKVVKFDELDEIIECEECGDNNNIHQLQILRFGLNDMSLLCQDCLNKEEKPSVQYSLSNGSLFKKIDQYYKFRDIECEICHDDKKLAVGNSGKTQHIICKKCLPAFQEQNPSIKFVGEDSDTFLSELLGLTEFVPKKTSGKKRGRNTMKRGPKRVNPKKEKEALERREFYFSKLQESKDIKGGTIVKAVGVNDINKENKLSNNTKSNGKPYSKPNSKANSRINSKSNSNSNSGANSAKQSRSSTPVPKGQNKGHNGSSSKPNNLSKVPSSSGFKSKDSNSHKADKKESNPGGVSNKASKSKEFSTKDSKVKDEKHKASKDGKLKEEKLKAPRDGKVREQKPKGSKDGKVKNDNSKDTKPKEGKTKENKPKDKSNPKHKDSKAKDKTNDKPAAKTTVDNKTTGANEKDEDIKLPKGIELYTPSKEPKLQYDSLTSYFQEMSFNLFLEEKFGISNGENRYIEPGEFTLGWFEEQDKKHKQFYVEIELTKEFQIKHLNRRLSKFRRSPLSVDQTILLVCNNMVPWYGKIVLAETKKARRKGNEILEVIIKLFPWNYQPLPTQVNIKQLSLLPTSVPISRVFYAMDRVVNPKFQKMLLGQQPIQQLVFNNYVKLSEGSRFNDSQKVALQSVLNNSITVLQGPPGTGKTSTIHEIILQLLNNFNTYPILVVAASNIAIDNIAEKLLESHGSSILRIVSTEKESDYNGSHKLANICLHNKMYEMLPQSMRDIISTLRSPRADTVSMNQHKKLRMKQYELSNTLVGQARVIFTTSVVAGGGFLKSIAKFPVVIMDEATQSSEPITLIPLSMPGVEKFVFVGDQRQLSSFTQVPNLSLSLFERVLLNGTYKTPHMLDTQYRMHPTISEFPRNKFYNGLLKDGITAEQRSKYPIKTPVEFWDTQGKCKEGGVRIRSREDHGFTYENRGEIQYLIEVLTKLIVEKNIDRKEIGVITPYRGQRDLISKVLQNNEIINPNKYELKIEVDRDDIENESKPVTIHTVNDIMIASIDAFQGREKDFIIFSCVRSNPENKIGFLNDERRLNVALTRARYGLVLIGDYECLSHDALWKEYLDHLTEKNLVNKSAKFLM